MLQECATQCTARNSDGKARALLPMPEELELLTVPGKMVGEAGQGGRRVVMAGGILGQRWGGMGPGRGQVQQQQWPPTPNPLANLDPMGVSMDLCQLF